MPARPGDRSPNGALEKVVREHAAQWTVLRSSWFAQNFTENDAFRRGIEARGELLTAVGDTAVSFVDTRDLGEVAAAVLTQDGHHGRTYDVTGPRAITLTEVATELTRAGGRPVRYPRLGPEDNAAALAEVGVPGPVVTVLGIVDAATRAGSFTAVSDTVPTVLGRPARDFSTFSAEEFTTGAVR
jgi:uncharacterized protein YbjT (DUF2867 family)